ncbi:MAG TPA: hypothetical protein VHA56_04715 [Mucilaginibacter sp.]|nr:hypothetical protein [Mucilaginibacter sp.]
MPAYLIILFSLLIGYTTLHWLLIIKLNLFQPSDDLVNFFIPMGLPWLPLLIWLRPRLKKLNYTTRGRQDPIAAIIIFSAFTMIGALLTAQLYMITTTGKLTILDKISDIHDVPETKYYNVHHYYLSKRYAHFFTFYDYTGKNHENFTMDVCVAIPVFDHLFPDTTIISRLRDGIDPRSLVIINGKRGTMSYLKTLPSDSIVLMRYVNPSFTMPKYGAAGKYGALLVATHSYKLKNAPPSKISPAAWLSVRFSKTLYNSIKADENESYMHKYIEKCYHDFMQRDYSGFTYLDQIANDERSKYLQAIQYGNNVNDPWPTILRPVYDSYARRNGNKLAVFSGVNGGGLLLVLLIVCLCKARPDKKLISSL